MSGPASFCLVSKYSHFPLKYSTMIFWNSEFYEGRFLFLKEASKQTNSIILYMFKGLRKVSYAHRFWFHLRHPGSNWDSAVMLLTSPGNTQWCVGYEIWSTQSKAHLDYILKRQESMFWIKWFLKWKERKLKTERLEGE